MRGRENGGESGCLFLPISHVILLKIIVKNIEHFLDVFSSEWRIERHSPIVIVHATTTHRYPCWTHTPSYSSNTNWLLLLLLLWWTSSHSHSSHGTSHH